MRKSQVFNHYGSLTKALPQLSTNWAKKITEFKNFVDAKQKLYVTAKEKHIAY